MKTDSLKYGVITLYEAWYFCKRDNSGTMFISPAFLATDMSPSVLQALRTILTLGDHNMEAVQAKSPGRVAFSLRDDDSKARDHNTRSVTSKGLGNGQSGDDGIVKSNKSISGSPDPSLHASDVRLECCELLFQSDYVTLLGTPCGRAVVKYVRDPRMTENVRELRREAAMYELLCKTACEDVIPSFRGLDETRGIPIICISAEGEDFEDIGLENLDPELKRSALAAVRAFSECGFFHGDLALRNIVQSKSDPTHAKLIDFGRTRCSQDQRELDNQICHARALLASSERQAAPGALHRGRRMHHEHDLALHFIVDEIEEDQFLDCNQCMCSCAV
jgi:tRNA A-37 threonylcarbamoyl transferase component Bud32